MKVAIIGMGPAGVNVVKTLRKNNFDDNITMFSAEKIPPYSPPSLGEYLISGNEEVLFWEGKDFCEKYNVVCRAGEKIAQINPEEKELKTETGETIGFEYLVIATGTSLYAPVKGSDKNGISDFKTFVGTDKIKRMAKQDKEKTATGVKPSIDLIKNTDIEYDTGIIVNEHLQTKYPYIYACGDVAETVERVSGERKIHGLFPVAVNHAQTVAYNILGKKREYEQQVNMNSLKKLSFKIIVVGKLEGEEIKYKTENVLRKIYLTDDKITGFVLLGDISNAGVYLSLFAKRVNVAKFKDELLSKYFYPGILITQTF